LARSGSGDGLAARDPARGSPASRGHPFFIFELVRAVQSGACEPEQSGVRARIALEGRLGRADRPSGYPTLSCRRGSGRPLDQSVAIHPPLRAEAGTALAILARAADPQQAQARSGMVKVETTTPRARDRRGAAAARRPGGAPPRLGPRALASGQADPEDLATPFTSGPTSRSAPALLPGAGRPGGPDARLRARRQALSPGAGAWPVGGGRAASAAGQPGRRAGQRRPRRRAGTSTSGYRRAGDAEALELRRRAAYQTVSAAIDEGRRPSRPSLGQVGCGCRPPPARRCGRCCSAGPVAMRACTPGGVRPAGFPPSSWHGSTSRVGYTGLTMIDPIPGRASRPQPPAGVACQRAIPAGPRLAWRRPTSRRSAAVAAAASTPAGAGQGAAAEIDHPTPSGWSRGPRGSPPAFFQDIGPRPSDLQRGRADPPRPLHGVVWGSSPRRPSRLVARFLGEGPS